MSIFFFCLTAISHFVVLGHWDPLSLCKYITRSLQVNFLHSNFIFWSFEIKQGLEFHGFVPSVAIDYGVDTKKQFKSLNYFVILEVN